MDVTTQSPHSVGRLERILAYMVASVVGMSIICFLAVIIGTAVGVRADAYADGAWPVVLFIPYVGLPLGFVLIITLMVIVGVRRSRENRQGRQ